MTSVVAAVAFLAAGTVGALIAYDSFRDLIEDLMAPERDRVGIVLDAILWLSSSMWVGFSIVCLAAVL